MSNSRRDSAINMSDPPSQLQQQVRVWGGRSVILSQHNIDAIYTAEYGEPTQQDRYDFVLLFVGLHQDIMELQERLLELTVGGVEVMAIAPCFFGRLKVIMTERVEALAKGKPLVVEGYPPVFPGRMMSQWVKDCVTSAPSLYDRIEDMLAAQVQQPCSKASETANSAVLSPAPSAVNLDNEIVTDHPRKSRSRRERGRRTASSKSRK